MAPFLLASYAGRHLHLNDRGARSLVACDWRFARQMCAFIASESAILLPGAPWDGLTRLWIAARGRPVTCDVRGGPLPVLNCKRTVWKVINTLRIFRSGEGKDWQSINAKLIYQLWNDPGNSTLLLIWAFSGSVQNKNWQACDLA